MSQYRFTLLETENGRVQRGTHLARRRKAIGIANVDYAITLLPFFNPGNPPDDTGNVRDTSGYYYSYEWVVDAPSYQAVKGLCDYFDTQLYVRTVQGPDPVLTEEESRGMLDHIAHVIEKNRGNIPQK